MPTQPQWLDANQVLQIIQQVPEAEWHERGAGILQAVLEEWKKHKKVKEPSVRESPFGKGFRTKATQVGPSFTGPIQDASGRHMCFRDGKRAPCEQFGGQGQGWSQLRSQEDLYDALRRLIDELKAGKHEGWHELIGLLVHAPAEDLLALKREHRLTAPADAKQALTQRLQQEMQHIGHTGGEQPQQPPMKSFTKAGEEKPKKPAPPPKPTAQPQQQAQKPQAQKPAPQQQQKPTPSQAAQPAQQVKPTTPRKPVKPEYAQIVADPNLPEEQWSPKTEEAKPGIPIAPEAINLDTLQGPEEVRYREKFSVGLTRLVDEGLTRTTTFPSASRKLHKETLGRALNQLPIAALAAVHTNVKAINFHNIGPEMDFAFLQSFRDFVQHGPKAGFNVSASAQKLEELEKEWKETGVLRTAGFYDHFRGALYVGGRGPEGFIGKPQYSWPKHDQRAMLMHLYLHEFSHAIDQWQRYSGTPEWEAAWKWEIQPRQQSFLGVTAKKYRLTNYAALYPFEGWAELGRAVYSGMVPLNVIEEDFPECANIFKKVGMWPRANSLMRGKALDQEPQGYDRLIPELFDASKYMDTGGVLSADWLLQG